VQHNVGTTAPTLQKGLFLVSIISHDNECKRIPEHYDGISTRLHGVAQWQRQSGHNDEKFKSDDGECKKYQDALFKRRDTSFLEDL
jgi:hypothetical protein